VKPVIGFTYFLFRKENKMTNNSYVEYSEDPMKISLSMKLYTIIGFIACIFSIVCIEKGLHEYRANKEELLRLQNIEKKYNNLQESYDELETNMKVLNKRYEDLKEEQAQNQEDYSSLQQENTDLKKVVKKTDKSLKKLKSDNLAIQKEYKALNKKYKKLAKRKELYNKYGYAIKDTDGSRTDLSYEDLQYGVDLMKQYGYNPHILFSMGMVESNFNSDCYMNSTGAAGYLQIIPSTGKFIYKKLLHKKGKYVHSKIMKDTKLNIQMAVAYLDYLFKLHPTKFRAIKQYCGGSTSFTKMYINRMKKYSSRYGVKIWKIISA
jgi:soluble lytic murein transglycosylase-like protein